MDKGALFTDCGSHRLVLHRVWNRELPLVAFIGLNPSTANETQDDPTIRRVVAMARSWGYGGVFMLNLFTYISTNPACLDVTNGNYIYADTTLRETVKKCKMVVFAWGNFKVHGRDAEVKAMFPEAYALQINKNGSPKHPLYVRAETQPIPYNASNLIAL